MLIKARSDDAAFFEPSHVQMPSLQRIFLKLKPYILKVDFLDVRNPQKIQIFRRQIVSECENYQFCNVLEKMLLIDTLSLCSIELDNNTS